MFCGFPLDVLFWVIISLWRFFKGFKLFRCRLAVAKRADDTLLFRALGVRELWFKCFLSSDCLLMMTGKFSLGFDWSTGLMGHGLASAVRVMKWVTE